MQISAIVLAAGKGTRMGSNLPKVLHKLNNETLLGHVCNTLGKLNIQDIAVVLGPETADFKSFMDNRPESRICIQHQRRGTADAVAAAWAAFPDCEKPSYYDGELVRGKTIASDYTLICYGDVPLVPLDALQALINESIEHRYSLAVIAMDHPNPGGYGRIVMKQDKFIKIVEDKDASPSERQISLCNTGIVFGQTKVIFSLLEAVKPLNNQAEYYLTDIFTVALERSIVPFVYVSRDFQHFAGVNTKEQLENMQKLFTN